MEKIILKDGTEIEISNGATENIIVVEAAEHAEVAEIVEKLTEENLEKYTLLNSDGEECATFENKCLDCYVVYLGKGQVQLHLADVDMVAKRLAALEKTQEMQDEAITELAEMAAGSEG